MTEYKHLLPGDRTLSERCKDFAKQNMETLTDIVATQNNFSRSALKELLKVCHMCGYINAAHWHDDECPGPNGSAFSESMFTLDKDLTEFSKSLFELLGGKLDF